jgi:PAN domain
MPKILVRLRRQGCSYVRGIAGAAQATRRRRMRRAFIVGFIALLSAMAGTGMAPAFAQSGYDRPGGDYTNAAVPNGDPAVCASRCEHDSHCRAWSFSYPSASGSPATCWLKRVVTPRAQASCCVSGVRGAGVIEPRAGELEYSIDRTGGDYRSFETPPDPKGKACADACHSESRCRAWTYRRGGYGTPTPRCFLKETIKPPHRRPCCISGVVR